MGWEVAYFEDLTRMTDWTDRATGVDYREGVVIRVQNHERCVVVVREGLILDRVPAILGPALGFHNPRDDALHVVAEGRRTMISDLHRLLYARSLTIDWSKHYARRSSRRVAVRRSPKRTW